ncbi:MAG: HAD family hydrolase [Bacteroidota bacterium]
MPIKSLIFDFDGLILDTETPDFRVWQSIYLTHGYELPADQWATIIGGHAVSSFDAADHLVELTGGRLDPEVLRARHRSESNAMIIAQSMMPGVARLMREARKRGLSLAIASSSEHEWVDRHLARLGMAGQFDPVICSDDVAPGRTKPNPDLYLKALEALGCPADQAIAFEDSLNGVRAAKAAGIFAVAVPNSVTSLLGVDGADLKLNSLEEFDLRSFLLGA